MTRRTLANITTVVFDLDDTLYDCHRQRVLAAHRYACRKLLAAGLRRASGAKPSRDSLFRLRRRLFREEPDLDTLDLRLCLQLGLDTRAARRFAKVGRRAYFSSPVGPLKLFSGALPMLKRLHKTGVRVCILTAGKRSIQQAKIRRLGLHRSPLIQRVCYTGLMQGKGKKHFLRRIAQNEATPKNVLVVGDRPDSEIRAARELGFWAVRRLGGEFAARQPRSRLETPHYTLHRLSELFSLPFTFGSAPQKHGTR